MTRDTAGQTPEPSRWLVPVLVLIGMVTAVISSLGAPLLPTIARVDHVSLGNAQWSLTIVMVVGAVTAPVLGRMGDGPFRRPVIFTALSGIVAGSVMAALPFGGFALLLVGRGLQGVGLGLMPLTMAVARDNLPAQRSARVIAVLSIATVGGAGLGYPLTGVIDDSLGLHATFWFGAILSAIALVISWPHIPSSRHLERRPLDIAGAILLGGALLALLIAVTEGQPWGWGSPEVVGLLAGAVVVLATWVWRERSIPHPLVDVRLLRHASLAATNLSAVLIAVSMYIYVPLVADFVQTPRSAGYGFGASVVTTGLMIVPFSVLSTGMSRVAAAVGARVGQEWVVPIGALIMSASVAVFALTGNALWEGYVNFGLVGIGIGFSFAAMPGIIVRAVPQEETGSALAFYQVVRYVGFALGSGVAATILAVYTKAGRSSPERHGFTVALLVSAAFCLVAALVSAAITRSGVGGDARTADRRVMETLPDAEVVFE